MAPMAIRMATFDSGCRIDPQASLHVVTKCGLRGVHVTIAGVAASVDGSTSPAVSSQVVCFLLAGSSPRLEPTLGAPSPCGAHLQPGRGRCDVASDVRHGPGYRCSNGMTRCLVNTPTASAAESSSQPAMVCLRPSMAHAKTERRVRTYR